MKKSERKAFLTTFAEIAKFYFLHNCTYYHALSAGDTETAETYRKAVDIKQIEMETAEKIAKAISVDLFCDCVDIVDAFRNEYCKFLQQERQVK